jgi:hypothetical protein
VGNVTGVALTLGSFQLSTGTENIVRQTHSAELIKRKELFDVLTGKAKDPCRAFLHEVHGGRHQDLLQAKDL